MAAAEEASCAAQHQGAALLRNLRKKKKKHMGCGVNDCASITCSYIPLLSVMTYDQFFFTFVSILSNFNPRSY